MGEDIESWLFQRQLDEQFPNAKSIKLSFDLRVQNPSIPCQMPCNDAAPMNDALPAFGFSGVSNIKPEQSKEPHGWFYGLPCFRQGFVPDMTHNDKSMPKTNLCGKVSTAAGLICAEANSPATGSGCVPKQFLVFDQTGNKTTMIFSSGIGTSVQRPTAWSRKPTGCYNVNGGEHKSGSDGLYYSGPNSSDDGQETDEGCDTHEDTDEINALLYSDDEDNYSDNGEETSTGHSPSTMTAYEKQDWYNEEDMDEVASSAGPVKRQKLSDSVYQVPSMTCTGSSIRPNRSMEYDDDAESSCAGCKPVRSGDVAALPGNKRLRKEKIRETVSLLQTILPGGKGKDAVVVLDEAINYLGSLKFKAECLGLSEVSDDA